MRPMIAYPGVRGASPRGRPGRPFPRGRPRGYATFPQAAQAALTGEADYALLPVENSFAGAVLPTYTLLERLGLHIVGETLRRVRHQLVGLPGATLADIQTISSHPQAIAQCDAFLATLPKVRLIPSANTAISAQAVARAGDKTQAAIASDEAAAHYGLAVLRRDIQTSQTNTTRFLILSRQETPLAPPDKATVVFRVRDEVGALVRVLSSFAQNGLNMSRIESRPLPETPFQYFFSADFVGAMDAAHLRAAMDAARPLTEELRLLGVYPRESRRIEPRPVASPKLARPRRPGPGGACGRIRFGWPPPPRPA